MKIELSKEEWENLEELKGRKGYQVLKKLQQIARDNTLEASLAVKSRVQKSEKIDIQDTADTQIADLRGFIRGIKFLLEKIERAYEIRKVKFPEKEQ